MICFVDRINVHFSVFNPSSQLVLTVMLASTFISGVDLQLEKPVAGDRGRVKSSW